MTNEIADGRTNELGHSCGAALPRERERDAGRLPAASPRDLRPRSKVYRGVVSSYTIGETAARSGFSASALRYYEGIGLVEPATRTDAGYRIYDDHTLARLAFIARAKQLGCSLEEITDLVGVWDGERCGPVQRRFHELITDKLRDARRQVIELSAFASQLQFAAEQLSGEPIDGPCDDGCACVSEAPTTPVVASPLTLGTKTVDIPIACTLQPGAMPARLANWNSLLGHAQARVATADGALRIEFGDGVDLGELARLVAAEQHCCAFFSFALTIDHRGIALEVRAPEHATGIVAELFGHAA
jgi:DNA-binding transcriptional MerR regulator